MFAKVFLTYILVLAVFTGAFKPGPFSSKTLSTTKLYEDFKLEKYKIYSRPEIYTEKQLREYTSQYSNDIRMNPIEVFFSFFFLSIVLL